MIHRKPSSSSNSYKRLHRLPPHIGRNLLPSWSAKPTSNREGGQTMLPKLTNGYKCFPVRPAGLPTIPQKSSKFHFSKMWCILLRSCAAVCGNGQCGGVGGKSESESLFGRTYLPDDLRLRCGGMTTTTLLCHSRFRLHPRSKGRIWISMRCLIGWMRFDCQLGVFQSTWKGSNFERIFFNKICLFCNYSKV